MTSVTALPAVKQRVQVPGHGAQVVQQWWGTRVEGGEDQALVAVQLGHRDEAPLGLVQLVVVGVLQVGHGGQLPVGAEGPAVVGADEGACVAVIGAAETVAPVAADVQEGVDPALPVAGDEDGVLAHVGGEEVAGVGDLGLVAKEEPAAGKNLLQLLLVDGFLAENARADQALIQVNQVIDFCQDHVQLLPPGLHRESVIGFDGLYYMERGMIRRGKHRTAPIRFLSIGPSNTVGAALVAARRAMGQPQGLPPTAAVYFHNNDGWGRSSGHSRLNRGRPHPNPLPEGEGTSTIARPKCGLPSARSSACRTGAGCCH